MPAPTASVTWTVPELQSSGVTAPPSAAFQDHAPLLRDPQENGQHLKMYQCVSILPIHVNPMQK